METANIGTYRVRRNDALTINLVGEEDDSAALINLGTFGPNWSAKAYLGNSEIQLQVDTTNINGEIDPGHDAVQLKVVVTEEISARMRPGTWLFAVRVSGGSVSTTTPYSGLLVVVGEDLDD